MKQVPARIAQIDRALDQPWTYEGDETDAELFAELCGLDPQWRATIERFVNALDDAAIAQYYDAISEPGAVRAASPVSPQRHR